LSKTPFTAQNWLISGHGKEQVKAPRDTINYQSLEAIDQAQDESCFKPQSSDNLAISQYLVPSWEGDGLLNKNSIQLNKTVLRFLDESKRQFLNFAKANRSLKLYIYNEFQVFCKSNCIKDNERFEFSRFWDQLFLPHSEDRKFFDSFIDFYCLRSVAIYIYKIRFILKLTSECRDDIKNILNPNSYLSGIFKGGSSKEISCQSLQTNPYSWFHPPYLSSKEWKEFILNLRNISISQLDKICSSPILDGKNISSMMDENLNGFSHSLSHSSFGDFLNILLTQFPSWTKGGKKQASLLENFDFNFLNSGDSTSGKNLPHPISINFLGDYLSSLCQAFWVGQKEKIDQIDNSLLAPAFGGDNPKEGVFLKLIQELQFLSHLVDIAGVKQINPIDLISNTFREKNRETNSFNKGQMSLFVKENIDFNSHYKNIILNLNIFPKKNPHHYLLLKINKEIKNLKTDGLLYVFSNQKLFVPSQSEKIKQLINELELKAQFNFEQLKGKGELTNFLYIFSKRNRPKTKTGGISNDQSDFLKLGLTSSKKETCLTFRWNGDLQLFCDLKKFVNEMQDFMIKKTPYNCPLYQKELSTGNTFECFQDVILEGKLLNSTSTDTSNITHPSFFKNITRNSIPIDRLFIIENINNEKTAKENITNDLLGIQLNFEEKYPLLLIVDFSDQGLVKIEITPSESYNAKVEQYGMAFYQYFGLIPKMGSTNIDLLREYFNTPIGKQIVQLSLNGPMTKTKGKLKSLLVPRFFSLPIPLPKDMSNQLTLTHYESDAILSAHPESIQGLFESEREILKDAANKYSWHTLGLLTKLKVNLRSSIEKLEYGELQQEAFKNPLIVDSLLKLDTHLLYPNNEDVYLEMNCEGPQDIHLPYTHSQIKETNDLTALSIYSNNSCVLTLSSDKELLLFIQYILTNATNVPISSILQGLQIPRLSDFLYCLDNFKNLKFHLESIFEEVSSTIESTFIQQISKTNSAQLTN
jgi:hypothetical protein